MPQRRARCGCQAGWPWCQRILLACAESRGTLSMLQADPQEGPTADVEFVSGMRQAQWLLPFRCLRTVLLSPWLPYNLVLMVQDAGQAAGQALCHPEVSEASCGATLQAGRPCIQRPAPHLTPLQGSWPQRRRGYHCWGRHVRCCQTLAPCSPRSGQWLLGCHHAHPSIASAGGVASQGDSASV
jgi:hypothetical protein